MVPEKEFVQLYIANVTLIILITLIIIIYQIF